MTIILTTLFGRQQKKLNRSVTQILPIRKTDGAWARNNEQKAPRFAEHLEHIFQLQERQEETEKTTEDIVQENEEINPTTTTEVKNEINKNINPKTHRDLLS